MMWRTGSEVRSGSDRGHLPGTATSKASICRQRSAPLRASAAVSRLAHYMLR